MVASVLEVWQKALGEVGTRSTVTQSDVSDPTLSQEGRYCNLFYRDVITQAIRAAHWNCFKKTDSLVLWKAMPGTPKNNTPVLSQSWSTVFPAPPWMYSYMLPEDCLQAWRVYWQVQPSATNPPIFSGLNSMYPSFNQLTSSRFEVASDAIDATGFRVTAAKSASAVALVAGGTGYQVGDVLQLNGSTISPLGYDPIVVPAQVVVKSLTGSAVATVELLLTENSPGVGYFQVAPTNPVGVTGGHGTGATFNLTLVPHSASQKVVLTNLDTALMDYAVYNDDPSAWDVDFETVIYMGLAGKLAIPLTGDKALANSKIQLANQTIVEARLRDANEGLTINDFVPDWIRVRGIGGTIAGDIFYYPFGPLFSLL